MRADKPLFWALVLVLVCAPLPLASNRAWAVAILEIAIELIALAWLLLYLFGRVHVSDAAARAWPACGLLLLWLALLVLQLLPLPPDWLALLSPHSLAAWQNVASLGAAPKISIDPAATEAFLLKSLAYVTAFWLVLVLVNSRVRLRQFVFAVILSGVAQAMFASFMHLSGANYELFFTRLGHATSAMGTFANRDHLAGYLEMTLALGIGMMIATLREGGSRNWRQRLRGILSWVLSGKILIRLMLMLMVIALVMTHSRMGNAAFFTSTLIAGVLGIALSRHATRSTVILLASLIVLDVFIVSTWFGMERLVQRLEGTTIAAPEGPVGTGREESVEERTLPARLSLPLADDYRWLGSGGGTYYIAFPKYRSPDLTMTFDYTHNDYVQFMVETGLIGTALVGLLVLWTFIIALRTQYVRRDALSRGVAFGVTMGIISLMIHSWVDFNLQIPANALTFVTLLALGWVAWSVERRQVED